jgi:hypothetical protein
MNVKISGELRHELESVRQILPEAAAIIPNSRFGFYEKMLQEDRTSVEVNAVFEQIENEAGQAPLPSSLRFTSR